MGKIAIYTRKSLFNENSDTIEVQTKYCIEYIEKVLNRGNDGIDVYVDEGFSGGNINRPDFTRMMNAIKAGKYDFLVVYKLDRLSRNQRDFYNTKDILDKHNCQFVSVNERFDTSTPSGKAMLSISMAFAEFERNTISERARDSARAKMRKGRYVGPKVFGYEFRKINYVDSDGISRSRSKIFPNPEEADVIRTMFREFINLKNFRQTAIKVDEIYNHKYEIPLFSSRIKAIINNPIYAEANEEVFEYLKNKYKTIKNLEFNGTGCLLFGKGKSTATRKKSEWTVYVGEHEPLVDAETFLKANRLADIIHEKNNKNSYRRGKTHVLSGTVYCARCGSRMTPQKATSKKGDDNRYYICTLRNQYASMCRNGRIKASILEDSVVNALRTASVDDIKKLYNSQKSEVKEKDNQQRKKELKEDIEKKEKKINSLINKLVLIDDIDVVKVIQNNIKKVREEIESAEKEINEINEKQMEYKYENIGIEEIIKNREQFKELYYATDDIDLKRELIDSVVKFVTWDSDTCEVNIVLNGTDIPKPKRKYDFSKKKTKIKIGEPPYCPVLVSLVNNGSKREYKNYFCRLFSEALFRRGLSVNEFSRQSGVSSTVADMIYRDVMQDYHYSTIKKTYELLGDEVMGEYEYCVLHRKEFMEMVFKETGLTSKELAERTGLNEIRIRKFRYKEDSFLMKRNEFETIVKYMNGRQD